MLTEAVDSALAAKGWSKSAMWRGRGRFRDRKTAEKDTMETFYDGFPGWGWRAGWWGGAGMAATQTVPERPGNLTVDVFDGQSKQLIFRVEASARSGNAEKNTQKMQHSI